MKIKSILASALLVITAASCTDSEKEARQQALLDSTKEELTEAVNQRDELLSLVNDISADMQQIKAMEDILVLPTDSENGGSQSQVKEDLLALKNTLAMRREKLAELESKLKKSNLFTRELQNTITNLQSQIQSQATEIENLTVSLAQANSTISSLNTTVDSLNTTVNTITEQRDLAEADATELDNRLNTCYYIVAEKSVLKEHKIIETGFLRKTKIMKGDFDANSFVTADKRTLRTLPLHATKAQILTNHPEGSWSMTENNGQKTLNITDPNRFWSLTNYLVVQIN
ncbi:MAG: hypothetical protein K2M94_00105 [Paramuribaculum sp.]|nr:hypothetical protein [Paramuribaculum sp.]